MNYIDHFGLYSSYFVIKAICSQFLCTLIIFKEMCLLHELADGENEEHEGTFKNLGY